MFFLVTVSALLGLDVFQSVSYGFGALVLDALGFSVDSEFPVTFRAGGRFWKE